MRNSKDIIRKIVRENFIKEMHQNDLHFRAIMKYYDKGTPSTKKQVSIVVTGKKTSNRGQIVNDLLDMDYHEILDTEKQLKYVKEYFDKKGQERVAAALPQTEEEPIEESTNPSDIIKDLDTVKNDLIKKADVLIAKKKKLYANVDIESPMSADEKKLNKDIADLFSEIQQLILQRRKIKN